MAKGAKPGRKAPKAKRAASKKRVVATRANATRVLAQGVAAPPVQPFGSDVTHNGKLGFNALIPKHLPLPRPVAPYTVVRQTKVFNTIDKLIMIGTWGQESGGNDYWLPTVAASTNEADGSAMGSATTPWTLWQMADLGAQSQCVPAAITVQVINGEALQTTNGIVFGTMMKQMPLWFDSATTIGTFKGAVVTTNPPRVMSAGKLALRGVHVDLMPFNMSALSDFRHQAVVQTAGGTGQDGTVQFATGGANAFSGQLRGFSPLFIQKSTNTAIEIVITVEWRVRFDPLNVAAASHRQYPHAPLSVWDRAVHDASALGHGVKDIVETVANVGSLIAQGAETAGRVYRALKPIATRPPAIMVD